MKNMWLWVAGGVGIAWLLSRQGGSTIVPMSPTFDELNAMSPSQRASAMRPNIIAAQRVLRDDGLYEGAIDGIVGDGTRRASAAWLGLRPSLAARLGALPGPQQEYELIRAIISRVPAERQPTL